jgi:hypothetical protein
MVTRGSRYDDVERILHRDNEVPLLQHVERFNYSLMSSLTKSTVRGFDRIPTTNQADYTVFFTTKTVKSSDSCTDCP